MRSWKSVPRSGMSSRSMPEYPVRVIVCDGSEFADVVDHVRLALTGQAVPPLFVVGPQVDPIEAAAEIAAQGYPVNTGVLMRTSGSTSGTGTIIALSWDSLVASANATHTALAGPGPWLADLPSTISQVFKRSSVRYWPSANRCIRNWNNFSQHRSPTIPHTVRSYQRNWCAYSIISNTSQPHVT